jgi:hypothetical protein
MAAEGTAATAEMLQRLTELLRRGIRPEGDEGFLIAGYDTWLRSIARPSAGW